MTLVKRRRPAVVESTVGADSFLDTAPMWLRAVIGAIGSVGASTLVIFVPLVVTWLTSADAAGSGGQALQLGVNTWLLAQAAPVDGPGGSRITVVPWVLTVVPLLAARWTAQWVVAALADRPDSRLTRLAGLRADVAASAAVFAGAHGLLGLLLRGMAAGSGFSAGFLGSVLGPAAVALVGFLLALRWEFRDELPTVAPGLAMWWERVPRWLRRAVRPCGWGVAALLLSGLLTVLLTVGLGWARVSALHGELSAGFLGGLVISLAQLLYLPTLSVWATSWLAGPGFGIGTDSSVTWGVSQPGLLPLVPVLGAVPAAGELPGWAWLGVLIPVVVGVGVAHRALADIPVLSAWQAKARTAAAAIALTGVAMTVLGAAASGSLGSGRLGRVGVNPLLFGAALVGEMLVGAALLIGVRELLARRGRLRLTIRRPSHGSEGAGSGQPPG